jgi:hypothetical protein
MFEPSPEVSSMKLVGLGCLGVAIAMCVAGTGCVVEQSVGPVDNGDPGDIVLIWSIDGDSTGDQCASHGAAQIEVMITDPSGDLIDDLKLPCTAEGTDETLPPGFYTATAQLEDSSGKPITTSTLPQDGQFTIYSDFSSPSLTFDFDDDSFMNGS